MSYHEGSNWQAKKEDEGKLLYGKEEFEKETNRRLTPNNKIPIGFSSDYQKGYKAGQEDANAVHEINAIKYPDFYESKIIDLITEGVTEGAEQWKAEYDNCRHLLETLCELKRWKDENLNMLEYASFKPKAWEAAKKFLEKYQHQ